MADLPTGKIIIPADVVRRAFGEETVLLNLTTGSYHGLNATGATMLDLLEETGSAAAVAQRVADSAGVAKEIVTADLAELCAQLVERGLIAVEE